MDQKELGAAEVRWCRRLAWIAFPVLLWAAATLAWVGPARWWSDDYTHNLRDPVTLAMPTIEATSSWPFWTLGMARDFFIRPLFYQVVPALTTLLWTTPWAAQALQAAMHAGVAALLFVVMRRLGLGRSASAASALAWMVYPANFEVIFWFSALPTLLAMGLALWMLMLHMRLARGGGWWLVGPMVLIAFAICCLNEQPAAAVLAMPMLYLAAMPPPRRARAHLLRALLPPLVCGLAVVGYVALLLGTAQPGHRGGAGSFVSLPEVPARLDQFGTELWRRMILKNFWRGAIESPMGDLIALGPPALFAAWAVVLAGVAWAWRAGRPDSGAEGRERYDPGRAWAWRRHRPVLAVLLGVAIFVSGWALIVPFAGYSPDSRLRAWPTMGLAIVLAAVGTLGRRWALGLGGPRLATVLGRGVLLALVPMFLAGAVMLIGAQRAFAWRHRLDHEQGRALREMVPSPTPLTFFVPVRIEWLGVRTGSPVFDVHFRSVWEFPWTTPKFIKTVFASDDVRAGCWRRWTAPDVERGVGGDPIRGADESGLHYNDRLGPRFPRIDGAGWRVPWELAVLFVIDADGLVRLVTHVEIPGREGEGSGASVRIEVPQARGQPELVIRLPRA